jgi:uncharacterized protein YhhL (DUF1145 family)
MPHISKAELDNRCNQLRHKCVLLRQIHSQRMAHFTRVDRIMDIGTLVAAAAATFVGFFGIQKITSLINLVYPASLEVTDFINNIIVFLVLLLSILNVAFQFKEKAHQHWRAINHLTDFVCDLDGILAVSDISAQDIEKEMAFINGRYKHVVDILPPTSDSDYFRAKKAFAKKKALKEKTEAK